MTVPNIWGPLNPAQCVRQPRSVAADAVAPLPVVIIGVPENTQLMDLAISAVAASQGTPRPLYVAAVFSDDTLTISDSGCPACGLVQSFIENALAIANGMQESNPQLRESAQWLKEFASFCEIEHAIWAVPEPSDEEVDLLFREVAQIFKHVWPASKIVHKEISL